MSWLFRSLNSSVGKKVIMAVTGLSLISFLMVHLFGNLTLYIGREAFNAYVDTLDIIKPFIRVIEVVLAGVFILHILNGLRLWIENRKARPTRYAVSGTAKNTDFSSRTMFVTGSIIFIFLVLHLSTFWYNFNVTGHPETGSHDFYTILVYWFSNKLYAVAYILAMSLLTFHLNHGFQSAFQTFGWNHKKYFSLIKTAGLVYALIMGIGFASIPIYFSFISGGNQ